MKSRLTQPAAALLLLFVLCLTGCGTSRCLTASIDTERRDSIRVETVTKYITDTVYLEIPAQTAQRETRDSVSHLENDYAESDARINPDGSLYHDLNTKPQKKPLEFEKPVERKDSIVYRTKIVTEIKVKEVPRKLTWFQKTQICGFWAFVIFRMMLYAKKRLKAHIEKFRLK